MAKRLKRNNPEILLYGEAGLPHLSQDEPPGTIILNELTGVLYVRQQNMSLLPVGLAPAYGGLLVHEASVGQVIAAGAAQKMTAWTEAFAANSGVDGQVANNRVVVARSGVYFIGWHMSYITSGPARWVGHIFLDGITHTIDWDSNIGGAGGPASASCSGFLQLEAGSFVEAYMEHDQVGDRTITPADAQLFAMRVG